MGNIHIYSMNMPVKLHSDNTPPKHGVMIAMISSVKIFQNYATLLKEPKSKIGITTGRQVPIFSYFSDLFLFIPIFPEKLLFFQES